MAEDTKPNKKGLIAGIIAAAAVIIVIACIFCFGKNNVVGKYDLSAYIQNGEESTQAVELLKALGGSYTVEFKNDKTGVIEFKAGEDNKYIEFKWDNGKITIENDDEKEESEYKLDGDSVTITLDGAGMKFTRTK